MNPLADLKLFSFSTNFGFCFRFLFWVVFGFSILLEFQLLSWNLCVLKYKKTFFLLNFGLKCKNVYVIVTKVQKYPCNIWSKISHRISKLGQNCQSQLIFWLFTHHPLSCHHHTKENKYISLPHVLMSD